jgi:hypothetical protein
VSEQEQEQETAGAAAESRGGIRPDWDRTLPGAGLPQLPEPELHDPPAGGDG